MKPAAFLAIDIGTSSTRSAIYDAKGNRLLKTTAQITYPLITDSDGRAELRPTDLHRAVTHVVAKTFASWRKSKSHAPAKIAAVGVSCFWHSLLGLDAHGRPITPVYTWADSRCRDQAAALRKNPGELLLHARTGCMARASFWPAKLLWLKQTQPALFRRVARWVSPAEWIQQTWCGAATVSHAMASGTGILDGRALRWHAPLLKRCGIAATQLNPISDAPGKISAAHARKFPDLAGAPWFPAIGDGAAGNLGSDATRPGIAAINVGTSAALRVILASKIPPRGPLAPFGLFCYRVDEKRRLLGGAVSNAGNLRTWALRELNLPADSATLEKLLAARQRPAENLTLLPFWIAERAPTWPEEMPSVVTGITQATTALDLLQALQEAAYHRLAQIAEAVEKAAGRKLAFIVSGGIQKSPESLQRLANVLGQKFTPRPNPKPRCAARPVSPWASWASSSPAPKFGAPIHPRATAARAYAKARQRQSALEQLMRAATSAQKP